MWRASVSPPHILPHAHMHGCKRIIATWHNWRACMAISWQLACMWHCFGVTCLVCETVWGRQRQHVGVMRRGEQEAREIVSRSPGCLPGCGKWWWMTDACEKGRCLWSYRLISILYSCLDIWNLGVVITRLWHKSKPTYPNHCFLFYFILFYFVYFN